MKYFLLEKNLLPDFLIRFGMRQMLAKKLREESALGLEGSQKKFMDFIEASRQSPISINTDDANTQHYELPPDFFKTVLGTRLKYSSGYWQPGLNDLNRSEEDMLALTAERAQLKDGQKVLELGCGWGSLSLWMAEHFPKSAILAVSNSRTQKAFIDAEAARRGLPNLRVQTAEMKSFETRESFDRIVTVEMFEHMRNYEKLFQKVSGFLKPEGKIFIHVFTHREHAYFYDDSDPDDWIAKYFFTGGTMPSDRLFLYFQEHLRIEKHWRVDGKHYQKTCRAWLDKMDASKEDILPIFREVYGKKNQTKWWVYWRVFFMACEELFAYRDGDEWFVSHYLFTKINH